MAESRSTRVRSRWAAPILSLSLTIGMCAAGAPAFADEAPAPEGTAGETVLAAEQAQDGLPQEDAVTAGAQDADAVRPDAGDGTAVPSGTQDADASEPGGAQEAPGAETTGDEADAAETQDPAAQAQDAADAQADATQACLDGHLQYTLLIAEIKAEQTRPARSAAWTLVGATEEGGAVAPLAQGATDANGDFSACAPVATIYDAAVEFSSHSDKPWRVVVDDGDAPAEHSFTGAEQASVSGIVDVGTIDVPEALAGAWKIIDDVTLLWDLRASGTPCWTVHETDADACTELEYAWPDAEEGVAYFALSTTQRIVLGTDVPPSQHTVLHEAGHWLQWVLAGKDFPVVTGCDPHYIEKPSSKSCAWTEGFADAVAAWALGDRRFVFPSGFSWPLENPDGIAWEGGDVTQGNVAGALLDLWAADGPDGRWDANIALMSRHNPADFRDYFLNARPAEGLAIDQAARDVIARHGIVYESAPVVEPVPDDPAPVDEDQAVTAPVSDDRSATRAAALASTGADSSPLLAAAIVLMLAGAAAFTLSRRSRRRVAG
ncbi:LPXTG cell wall anchor domain-containing protein [Microbacterium sp. NPDC058342]|uniref:LPXTG cell wall anchor domain-containing protein n=1 Tax=Microbacterium sp. NPDC058342 TaxID=3346454 RepID=UPI003669481E